MKFLKACTVMAMAAALALALAAMGLSGLVLLVAGSRMHVGRRRNKGDES